MKTLSFIQFFDLKFVHCIDFMWQKTNPVVAEIFSLMSRDEARHAGYVHTALQDLYFS